MTFNASLKQLFDDYVLLSGYAKVEINQDTENQLTISWNKNFGRLSGEIVTLPACRISYEGLFLYKSIQNAEGKSQFQEISLSEFIQNCELDFVYYPSFFETANLPGFTLYSDIVNVDFSIAIVFSKIVSFERYSFDYRILPYLAHEHIRLAFSNDSVPKSSEIRHLFASGGLTIWFKEYFGNSVEPDDYSYLGLQITTDESLAAFGIYVSRDCSQYQNLVSDDEKLILFERYNSDAEPWACFKAKVVPYLNFRFLLYGNMRFSKEEWIKYISDTSVPL